MPNKTQEYLNLAQQTAKELTRYWENLDLCQDFGHKKLNFSLLT